MIVHVSNICNGVILLYYLACMVEYHELSRPSIAQVP